MIHPLPDDGSNDTGGDPGNQYETTDDTDPSHLGIEKSGNTQPDQELKCDCPSCPYGGVEKNLSEILRCEDFHQILKTDEHQLIEAHLHVKAEKKSPVKRIQDQDTHYRQCW